MPCGCGNPTPQTQRPDTTHGYSFPALQVRNPEWISLGYNHGVGRAAVLLGLSGRNPFLGLLQLLEASRLPWPTASSFIFRASSVPRTLRPLSHLLSLWPWCLPLTGTLVVTWRPAGRSQNPSSPLQSLLTFSVFTGLGYEDMDVSGSPDSANHTPPTLSLAVRSRTYDLTFHSVLSPGPRAPPPSLSMSVTFVSRRFVPRTPSLKSRLPQEATSELRRRGASSPESHSQ